MDPNATTIRVGVDLTDPDHQDTMKLTDQYLLQVYRGTGPHSRAIDEYWGQLLLAADRAGTGPGNSLEEQLTRALALSDNLSCADDPSLIPLWRQPIRGLPHERLLVLRNPVDIVGELVTERGAVDFTMEAQSPNPTFLQPGSPIDLMQELRQGRQQATATMQTGYGTHRPVN
ncbi:MAG: hypothetical protein MMC23_007519 [Stictis urceolatum]|nr:hypothetical protein [Stictis urceolata]